MTSVLDIVVPQDVSHSIKMCSECGRKLVRASKEEDYGRCANKVLCAKRIRARQS